MDFGSLSLTSFTGEAELNLKVKHNEPEVQ